MRAMGHQQKGKGHKRKKSWHRGRGEGFRFQRVARKWPDVETDADPTQASIVPINSKNRERRKR